MKKLLLHFLAFALALAPAARAIPLAPIVYPIAEQTGNTGFFDPTPVAPVGGNTGTTLGQQRRIALQYAAQRWADQIQGTIPMKIRAGWFTANNGTLASCASLNYFVDPTHSATFPLENVAYPAVLADQLAGEDLTLGGTSDDMNINCNAWWQSNGTNAADPRRWYYGLDGNAPGTINGPWFDFVGVLFHEIGHGLGFLSNLNPNNGTYNSGFPTVWDVLMSDSAGNAVQSMSAAQRAPAAIGNDLFNNGPVTVLMNGGVRPRLFAPSPFQPGSSLHHYDEATYSAIGSLNELMTPAASQPTQVFGVLVTGALRDMGYTMADTLPPTSVTQLPAANIVYRSSALVGGNFLGTATDTSTAGDAQAVGLLRVRVALSRNSDGQFFNWSAGAAGSFQPGAFDYVAHTKVATVNNMPIATGVRNWECDIPPGLAQGMYQLHVTAVDQNDQGSAFAVTTFGIDDTAPVAAIDAIPSPLTTNAMVAFTGTATDNVGVTGLQLFIRRNLDSYWWNGADWQAAPPGGGLARTFSGGNWECTATRPVPGVSMVNGTYAFIAIAQDAAAHEHHVEQQVTVDYHASYVWTGAVNNDWNNGANWTGAAAGTVPSSADHVTIASGTPTMPGALTLHGLTVNGGRLIAPSITVTNSYSHAGGVIEADVNLGAGVTAGTWGGGTFVGDMVVASGATLTLNGGGVKFLAEPGKAASITNNGTIVWAVGAGYLQGQGSTGPATIHNAGTLELARDGTFLEYGTTGGLVFNNTGRVVKTGGAGISYLHHVWAFTNEPGAIIESAVAGGIVERSGNATPMLLKSGSILRGPGIVRLGGSATVSATAGSWTVEGDATLSLAGMVLTCPSSSSLSINTTPGSRLEWLSGTILGNLTIPAGVTMHVTGGSVKFLAAAGIAAQLDVFGIVKWAAGATYIQGHGGTGPASITVFPLARFQMDGDGSPLDYTTTSNLTFTNLGRVEKTGGTGTTFLHNTWEFHNEAGGRIESQSGTIERSGGNTPLHIKAGSRLAGPGTIRLAGGADVRAQDGAWEFINNVHVSLDGATLKCPAVGALTPDFASGTMEWRSGTITGNLTIPANGTLTLGGNSVKFLAAAGTPATLANEGTIVWAAGAAYVQGHGSTGPATINNAGTFDLAQDGGFLDYTNASNLTFNNTGRLRKTGGAGVTTIHNAWAFNNEPGAIIESAVMGGTIERNGSFSPFTLKGGSILRGPGIVRLGAAANVIAEAGTLTVDGGTTLDLAGMSLACPQAGSLTVAPAVGASLEWSAGTIHGNMNIPAGATLNLTGGATKRLASATQPAVLTNAGTIAWAVGSTGYLESYGSSGGAVTIHNSGILDFGANTAPLYYATGSSANIVLNNTGTLRKSAGPGDTQLNYWTINNAAIISAAGGFLNFNCTLNLAANSLLTSPVGGGGNFNIVGGSVTLDGPATMNAIVRQTGGTLTGNANASLFGGSYDWQAGTIAGTLRVNSGAYFAITGGGSKNLFTGAVLNNAGRIVWTGGVITTSSGGTIRNLAGGIFDAQSTGYLDYASTLGFFINEGTVNVGGAGAAGVFNATYWDFTQNATGVLNIELGGTSAAQHDRITTNRAMALSGQLNVTLLPGFTPAVGNTFGVLTHASRTGTFATLNGNGSFYASTYGASTFTLTATVEAATLADWKTQNFGNPASPEAADGADPDFDGIPNIVEYALALNPHTNSQGGLPASGTDSGHLTFTFARRVTTDVTMRVEATNNLTSWTTIAELLPGGAWTGTVSETGVGATRTATVTDPVLVASAPGRFLRLKIVTP